MESLYHQTNRSILEIEDMLNRTDDVNAEPTHAIVEDQMETVFKNCEQLEMLVDNEPVSRRNNAMLCVHQLKRDCQYIRKLFKTRQKCHRRKMRVEELLQRIRAGENVEYRPLDNFIGQNPNPLQIELQVEVADRDRKVEESPEENEQSGIQNDSTKVSNTTIKYSADSLKKDKYMLYGGIIVVIILFIIIVIMYFI